jgi:DNA-binding CsgD family transcriptional regulator
LGISGNSRPQAGEAGDQETQPRAGHPIEAVFGPWVIDTAREHVTLAQIVRGASSKEAGRLLGISPRTVEFHRANIMEKLGAKNTVDFVRRVLEE